MPKIINQFQRLRKKLTFSVKNAEKKLELIIKMEIRRNIEKYINQDFVISFL